jgi:hypothetical protein
VFFVGYFLFELPSNLALHRIGARVWIARIMVTWGVVSGAMAFTGALAQLTGLGTRRASPFSADSWWSRAR